MKIVKKLTYSSLCIAVLFASQACNGTAADKNNSATEEVPDNVEFVQMLDQNSLKGWNGDSTIWKMENGILIGEIIEGSEPLKNNTFLIWEGGEPADFVLKGKFKISESGNSGVNYRSERVTEVPYALKGYQADIDGRNNYTGQNYEERKRTTLAYRGQRTQIADDNDGVKGESKNNAWTNLKVIDTLGKADSLKDLILFNDWNEIEIIADGNKLSHYINGVLMSETIDDDTKNRTDKGLIGLQVHVGPPMKVEYKDLQIKMLK